MSFKRDLWLITHHYYLINIFLSLSYLLAVKLTFVCSFLFPARTRCELDARESEILFFLLIVVMIRSRKTGSTTLISYMSSSFMYTKVANMILWFYADFRMGLLFVVLFVLTGLFFPEPAYSGPQNVTYFRGLQGLEEELERDKHVNWLVAFYTMWSPSCNALAPTFAQISGSYHTDKLRFGKVDIGRYPEAGKKYYVNDSPVSKQLPTLILFQNGKEVIRRPMTNSKGKLQKFFFTEDSIRVTFDLNNLYEQSQGKTKVDKKSGVANTKKEQ